MLTGPETGGVRKMSNTQFAILMGFLAGVFWIAFGFIAVLLGIVLAIAGYFVGRVLDGQIDLQSYIQRYSGTRPTGSAR
jgi:membrane protein implicated in regulation of membrane protease activity